MAKTIEFINDRIASATDKINKKENTIRKKQDLVARKCAKLASKPGDHGLEFDISMLENDLERLSKEVSELKTKLTTYQDELAAITEKANSRNVKAILDFLAEWKVKVYHWYEESIPRYFEAKARLEAQIENDRVNMKRKSWEQYIYEERLWKDFYSSFGSLNMYLNRDKTLNAAKLNEDLRRDAEAKYDDLIERVTKVIGTIKDANDLDVGEKGELEGYIIGERGKAHVQTVGAGGYNIQRFHFRTLVHKVN